MTPVHTKPVSFTASDMEFLTSIGAVDVYGWTGWDGKKTFGLNFGYGCLLYNAEHFVSRPELNAESAITYRDHHLRPDIEAFIQAYQNLLS